MVKKILLDTDIGSDIDDAVCLAYLLANPDCQLLGITTVTGEAEKRAMLASSLCKVAGKDIPIFPGCENPLIVSQQQPYAPQAAALKNWAHDTIFQKNRANQFMHDAICRYPGEITLLTIAPLTNIGLLFSLYPEVPSLLKGIVMMCGVFSRRLGRKFSPCEWNARLDPHAAAIVYKHNVEIHHSIGADVTSEVTMAAREVRRKFQARLLLPVLDFAEVWFTEREFITFHDPLAATTIFDSEICRMEKGEVEVELTSDRLLGFTHWTPDPVKGRHSIAASVDQQKFFREYFSVFE